MIEIISLSKYNMSLKTNDDRDDNFVVYEVTLKNIGDKKIYFYPIVYAERPNGCGWGSGHMRARTMNAGQTGTLTAWSIPRNSKLSDCPALFIVQLDKNN